MENRSTALSVESAVENRTADTKFQFITRLLDDGKQKKSIKVLDGVRAIACLSVLTFHVNFSLSSNHIAIPVVSGAQTIINALAIFGQCGVVLFFVLSGFLLFLPYAKALLFDSTWPSLRQFYLRRIFRIVPAYYVALFFMVLLFNRDYFQINHWHDLWLFLTFRQDFPGTYQKIDGPFWTLAVEFQFYLVLPLLAWIMRLVVRRGKAGWRLSKLTFLLIVMIAWGLASLYWGNSFGYAKNTPISFLPDSVFHTVMLYIYGESGKSLEVFAVGMFLCGIYIFLQESSKTRRRLEKRHIFTTACFLIGLTILAWMTIWHFYTWYYNYTLHFLDPYRDLLVNSWNEWQGILYALGFALCIFGLLTGPSWLKRPFEYTPLRWIGLISFSLYMWHDPLIEFFTATVLVPLHVSFHSTLPFIGLLWLWVLVVIIPISLVSYLWIEKPGIRMGEKFQRWLLKIGQPVISTSQHQKALPAVPEILTSSDLSDAIPTQPLPALSAQPISPLSVFPSPSKPPEKR